MDLYDELRSIVDALDGAEVPYAAVGAVALAVHGVPRATTDIDLLIPADQVDKILDLVRPLGFRFVALPIRFSDGMELRRVTKLEGGEQLTLDLLLVDQNLEPVWSSREKRDTDEGALWVISREALIQMKTLAGRTRDLADIERLEELDR